MSSTNIRSLALGIAAAALASITLGAVEPSATLPVYPEGAPTPRGMTPEESAWVKLNPTATPRAVTPPPSGPVRAVAEYEPMDGIIMAYEGPSGHLAILDQMAANITTIGDARVYLYCDTQSEANIAVFNMGLVGADTNKVVTLVKATDTIWSRDYGPRYIYQGDVRGIVDHTYNRPSRVNDNAVPAHFAGFTGHALYEIPLIHGGGNYHLEATGPAWSTELISDENPSLTDQQIEDYWNAYQGTTTTITDAFPSSVDSTRHIDMWDIMIADDKVIISDFPLASGSAQDQVCDNHAAAMSGAGYTVYRVPAVGSPFSTHFTYTNAVICNSLVLLPKYDTIPNAAAYNAQSLATWQAALPGSTIVQVDCDAIVTFAGVMHCICMHVPVNKNGAGPGAYLASVNGGETFEPGEMVEIVWLSDDDVSVSNVDLLLSTNGGAGFGTVIASATADDGSFMWTVPDLFSDQARIRVVARDAQGNTGSDDSDASFTINGAPACPEDLNGDGVVDTADLGQLIGAFGTADGDSDINGDGIVDTADLGALIGAFGTVCD
jgi:agmatine/peptidylarginine deiminase